MKSAIISVILGLAVGYGLMSLSDNLTKQARLSGCIDAIFASIEKRAGPMPEEFKEMIQPKVVEECKDLLGYSNE